MNRGLISKTICETCNGTLIFGAGLFAIQIMFAFFIPDFQEGLGEVLEHFKFVQYIAVALLGTEMGSQIGPQAIAALPWVHPVVLALIWAHGIMFCTRVPVAEIERGTIDVLMALPVRRSDIVVSDSIVWFLWACVLAGSALLGNIAGTLIANTAEPIAAWSRVGAAANLVCVYLCVGAVARVFSSCCDRRGRAIGAAFAVVVASFVLQSFAMFGESLSALSFLGLMEYYRPIFVLSGRGWAWEDMGLLLMLTGVLWAVSFIVFDRRDIRTN